MDVARPSPRFARGLTLVELLTTTAVLGISLAIVVPSWSGLAQRNQVTATANQLLTHLRYARGAAVTYHDFVSLCPSDDGASCSGDPLGWHRGYLVFRDTDGNRARDPGEPLLRVQGQSDPGMRLHSTAGRPAIRFRADGAAWSTSTTFSVCAGDNPDGHRAVILYGTGRARVDRRRPGDLPVTCS
jgi:type IV fimbrial biogenesis protein FimT